MELFTASGATLGANTFTGLQTITQAAANTGILASTGYSLTGSNATSMVSLAGTLNTSADVDLIRIALTDTASGANTNIINVLAGAGGNFPIFKLDHVGNVTASTSFRVGSSQVVAGRDTGWAAMTGTPDKATALATSTVTLAQLAGRVMAMQTALTTHGLLGA